ncbi:hypothetical protein Tco_0473556, partial [Tanacetum coccineum]
MSIREALGGYTRDLDSFRKKQDKIAALHEVVSRIVHRAWRRHRNFLVTPSGHTRDGVKNVMRASEHNRLKRNLRRFSETTASENLRRRR